MIQAEARGIYDFSRAKDSLTVQNHEGRRVAIFLSAQGVESERVNIAVDLPDSRGTRTYSVNFGWLLDHLARLEPERAA